MQKQLQALATPQATAILAGIKRGIEKESLRVRPDGTLSQSPHPAGLGSTLTHNTITTDYSEALLEFITPVSTSVNDSLAQLEDIHRFVYQKIDEELLWATSMPCVVTGDSGIPVAQYGSSNVARMKTVYRYGLGHRYGRLMQAIAGIHYNFSMPEAYWDMCWAEDGAGGERSDYITRRYLGLIRNFHRYSWLLIYLFGASPAVCASFLRGRTDHGLQPFDPDGNSLYLPHGTALRMGDLGYNSDAQKGLNVCYNSLDNYIETLTAAILQPHSPYSDIPAGEDGDYQQLNKSLLQIENEFYSPIRPKRVAKTGETALSALVRGGIEYIEVRCIDVSSFTPVGLDAAQIRFLDTFLMYCLLQDSPDCNEAEQAEQAANLEAVVNRGREPGLTLNRGGTSVSLTDWGRQLCEDMAPVAELLDGAHDCHRYSTSLADCRQRIDDPNLTPSARVLREMSERNLPFFPLALDYSRKWAEKFRGENLPEATQERFEAETQRSIAAQQALEEADSASFEEYLSDFYAQYTACQE